MLYVNYSGYLIDTHENQIRIPANMLIRNYFGINVIKEFAKGNYIDFDAIGSIIEFIPCENKAYIESNTVLKVIQQ